MSVKIKVAELTQIRDIFVLYSKKNGFNIEEYADVGTVYKRVNEMVSGDSKKPEDEVDMEHADVGFIYNTLNVCSNRAPVEVQNYKVIGSIFETLTAFIQQIKESSGHPASSIEEIEETKE